MIWLLITIHQNSCILKCFQWIILASPMFISLLPKSCETWSIEVCCQNLGVKTNIHIISECETKFKYARGAINQDYVFCHSSVQNVVKGNEVFLYSQTSQALCSLIHFVILLYFRFSGILGVYSIWQCHDTAVESGPSHSTINWECRIKYTTEPNDVCESKNCILGHGWSEL